VDVAGAQSGEHFRKITRHRGASKFGVPLPPISSPSRLSADSCSSA